MWIVGTLLTAFPWVLPLVILLIAKVKGFSSIRQRRFFWVSLMAYGLALVALLMHCMGEPKGISLFYEVFYRGATPPSVWAYVAYALELVAAVCLLVVINWKTLTLFFKGRSKA